MLEGQRLLLVNGRRHEEATSSSQKMCRKCISECRIDYLKNIQMQINDKESLAFEFYVC